LNIEYFLALALNTKSLKAPLVHNTIDLMYFYTMPWRC